MTHRKWKCDLCDKAFRHPFGLQQHVFTHTGERPHKCSQCPKAFYSSNDLRRHSRIHSGNVSILVYLTDLYNKVYKKFQTTTGISDQLKAIFHCGRFASATNCNHVKNQSRGHAKKVECSSTFMACPRAVRRTKNAQVRQLQRKLSNVHSARAGKATAMENGL